MSPLARPYVTVGNEPIHGSDPVQSKDPVLAALMAAPVVPFSDEERAMIAAAKADPRPRTPAAEFMGKLAALAPVG
jgi:hypothetical protein